MYAVILAGGGGTRLWPLSRPERPKPFLPLLGERTLLRATWDRIVPALVAPADVFVVTDRRYTPIVHDLLPELSPGNVLAEPSGRNTAAAIALAAAALERPDGDVMIVLPADHLVRNEAGFCDVLRAAAAVAAAPGMGAADAPLVTLGIAPTGPETGYGYVVAAGERPGTDGVLGVARFVEKPTARLAAALLAGPAPVAWNAGIFLWRRDAIMAAFGADAPDILDAIRGGLEARDLPTAYATVRQTSIDYAILEPASLAGRVAMLRADVGWSDLGSWAALRDALVAAAREEGRPANVVGSGERFDIGSEGTLVIGGGRPIVTIGLRDVIIVDTPDAVLVAAADRSQEVRQVADEMARTREEHA